MIRLPPGLQRNSLGLRLVLGTLAWVLAALVSTGLVLTDLFEAHVSRQFRAELQMHLDQLAANLEVGPDGQPLLKRDLSDPRLKKPYSGLYWQVSSSDGQALLRSRSLWDTTLTAAPASADSAGTLAEAEIDGPGGTRLQLLERSIRPAEQPEQTLRLQVAADRQGLAHPVRDFAGILTLALGLLALGLLMATLIQVRLGLAPLQRLRQSLGDVREGRQRQLQGRYPAEIQPLVDEFNSVLAHDTEVLTRARTQAGNLAHAIKTPLAILANAAHRENGELAQLVTEQVATARRQVDYHLARARAAAAVQLPGLHTPVQPLLEGLVRVMQRLHVERGLNIELAPVPPTLAFRGEAQDFQEMLGNLLDNACKWAQTRVQVSATASAGDKLRILVADDGPGLPESAREAVFNRGVRADEQVPGSGLGLAIVRDLALLYGGAIELDTSPQGGLAVSLRLPAQARETTQPVS